MASTTTAGLPEMLMEMGDVFHPVAELIRMPSDMQFMTLVNYPQSLILIRNSVMLLTQAGFSLHNLQEMGVAAEVLLACIQTGMPTPTIDPSFSAPVPVVSEPDTESSHIADSSFEDKAIVEEMSVPLSMSPPPGEPEDRPPVADETELFSEKELVHSPVSCAESKHSQHEDEKVEDVDMANVLPSPVLSDMELDNDPNLIFTITAAKLLERSKRGQSQILGKTPPLEDLRPSSSFPRAIRQPFRPVAADFNQYRGVQSMKKFIPDDFRPIIIELSDDEDIPTAASKAEQLDAEILRLSNIIARKEGSKNGKKLLTSPAVLSNGTKASNDAAIKRVSNSSATTVLNPVVVQPVMGSNQSSLPHFGTTSDIAAFSLMKKKFKEDIIADEKLLESAMKDISQKEDTLLKLTEKLEVSARSIEEKECALKSLEEKVALLKSRIDDAKAEITFFNEESSDLSCQVNVLKKAIVAKGNLATELRGAINLKQKHLLDISKPKTTPMFTDVNNKRKRPGNDKESLMQTVENLSPQPAIPNGSDFIRFDCELPAVTGDSKLQDGTENFQPLSAVEMRERLESISWDESKTVRVAIKRGDFINYEDEFCSVADFPVILKEISPAPRIETALKHASAPRKNGLARRFQPYKSPLEELKSLRFRPDASKADKTMKINPMKKFCLFEMQGGACNDTTCSSQHLRDVAMSDKEVVEDYLSNLESLKLPKLQSIVDGLRNLSNTAGLSVKQIKDVMATFWNASKLGSADFVIQNPKKDRFTLRDTISKQSAVDTLKRPEIRALAQSKTPILVDGLWRMIFGDDSKVERYHNSGLSEDDYEKNVRRKPRDVDAWMEYAVDMLPTPLTLDSLNSPVALNKSLGIVVRGLEVNRDSEALWSLYIELLGHHVGTATGLREVFEEALKFLPNSFEIWWRFYLYEPVHKEKENILRKIIVSFSSSSQSRDIVSRSITSATLHLSKLFCDYSLDELSVSWLLKFLTSSNWDWVPNMTEAESIKEIWGSRVPPKDSMAHAFLTEQDLNTCWVTVFHLIYSGTFPETLFYDYPFDFIAVPCYFLIKWDALEENAVTSVTISELSEIWETVLYELLKDLEGNRRSLFFVLLRGYAEFLRDAAKNVGQAQRLVKIFFEKTVFSEELSLLYFALFQEPISQVAPISAECWGMKAKHTLRNGDLVGAAHDLVQGVYSCFKDIVKVEPFESLDDASQEIDDAIDHVKSLLRLQTDLSFTLKLEPKLDIAGYRENPCIWMILVLMEVWKVTAIGIQTDVRQILSWAIDAVSGQGEQRLLWLEMMKWEVSSGLRHSGGIGSKKILGTLEEAIDAVKERSGGLFKAEDAFPRCSQRNSRMRRSSDLQPLIQAALKGLAKEQKADLLEVLLQSRPETIVFSPALVKLFFDVKAWKQARAFILACLVANPKSIHRWDLLLTLEDLGGALGSKDSIPGLLAIAGFFLDKDDVEMLRGRYSKAAVSDGLQLLSV